MSAILSLLVFAIRTQAADYGKILLETNALGYTELDQNVAYSENYEVDTQVRGNCIEGPPPGGAHAPDAVRVDSDSQCRALGQCAVGFTQVSFDEASCLPWMEDC